MRLDLDEEVGSLCEYMEKIVGIPELVAELVWEALFGEEEDSLNSGSAAKASLAM